jgi:hypothetical protein
MSKLHRLQYQMLPLKQLFGYAAILLVGSIIILLSLQLYLDLKPKFTGKGGVLGNRVMVASKKVSMFKTMDKSGIYFRESEIKNLKQQPFTADVAAFLPAQFEIGASTKSDSQVPGFYTDLFFEGIPEKYLDVETDKWNWKPGTDEIPIILPRSYLKLYNFGFAESQDLPVVSENTIQQFSFAIKISGQGKSKDFSGRIAGFSDQLNSILVPASFIKWANQNYGNKEQNRPTRLLMQIKNPDDPDLAGYFQKNNIEVDKNTLEQNKVWSFLRLVFVFLFVIACIIIALACIAMLLGLNLMFFKNKAVFNNLNLLGFTNKKIGGFYQVIMGGTLIFTLIIAWIICEFVHERIREALHDTFRLSLGSDLSWLTLILAVVLLLVTSLTIVRSIKKVNREA